MPHPSTTTAAPTGAAVRAFQARVGVGTVLRCVRNTYRPELDGQLRIVLYAGASHFESEVDGTGAPFRTDWPARVADVVDVDADEMTWGIGRAYCARPACGAHRLAAMTPRSWDPACRHEAGHDRRQHTVTMRLHH